MNDPDPPAKEKQLAEMVAKFHREQQGHSPKCTASILPSMAVVVSKGIFTNTESELAGTGEGRKLIQSARREQRALTRREIERRVAELLQRTVHQSFYDLDVRSGEQAEIYIFD